MRSEPDCTALLVSEHVGPDNSLAGACQVAGRPPINGGRRHLQSRTMEQFAKVFNASYGACEGCMPAQAAQRSALPCHPQQTEWAIVGALAGVGLVSDLAMRQGSTMQESQTIVNDVLNLAQAALQDLKVCAGTASWAPTDTQEKNVAA